jgi:para-nitrobenzyl esterase
MQFDSKDQSEDCLFLNIFTPLHALEKEFIPSLPVIIFFHSGGFLSGNNLKEAGVCYESLNKRNTILVSVNYRLNVCPFYLIHLFLFKIFGFYAHPALRLLLFLVLVDYV